MSIGADSCVLVTVIPRRGSLFFKIGDTRMRAHLLTSFFTIALITDPRLLARFDTGRNQWRLADGEYRVALGKSANDLVLTARTNLSGRYFGR
jgi:hypothetical protein